ncbi:uncharacterized protein LOC129581653 [Paramacrobiotus metropolitanus]|uniref:uncharacterized protein LOC129581653 n=1 Tax=Paramacrobiotus metropolitanus TaxID=2943436 RepID=UPI0024462361|nr:uncharacterized protein LOC129581653 [Paramacrobiotus metropolitanus]
METAACLEDMPLEVLQRIGHFSGSVELSQNVRLVNKWLLQIFSDESYWEQRMKQRHPYRFSALSKVKAATVHPSPDFWRKAHVLFERKNRIFIDNSIGCAQLCPWNVNNQHKHFWTIASVAFCNEGKLIAAGCSDPNSIILWNVAGVDRELPVPVIDQGTLHTNKVSSIRNERNVLSTGSWDKSILLTDLTAGLAHGTIARLRTENTIESHDHHSNLLVAGSTEGFCEFFDVRTSQCFARRRFISDPSLLDNSSCRLVKALIADERSVVVSGWDQRQRLLKLFDIRSMQYISSTLLPYGNGSADAQTLGSMMSNSLPEMQINDGFLWCSAENNLWQYRVTDSSLDLLFRNTFDEDNFGRIVGMHNGHGHVMLVRESPKSVILGAQGTYLSTMYERIRDSEYRTLWDNAAPAYRRGHIATAFDEVTCKFAMAMSDGFVSDRITLHFPLELKNNTSV